jgi:hypothetical protein
VPNWSGRLDLQRRSRRNALTATVTLRSRRADSAEAQRSLVPALTASLLDGRRPGDVPTSSRS